MKQYIMEVKRINKNSIKSIYTYTGPGDTLINPNPNLPYNQMWAKFNTSRIFYLLQLPKCNGGLIKVGVRGKPGGQGGYRLREYYVAYGFPKEGEPRRDGLTILQVTTFEARKRSETGEKGSEQNWAEHVFEKRVLNRLKELEIYPERGDEYFPKDKLKDIKKVILEIRKKKFTAGKARVSERIKAQNKLLKEGYQKPEVGDVIEYTWNIQGTLTTYRGVILKRRKDRVRELRYEIDFTQSYTPDESWNALADLILDKNTYSTKPAPDTFRFISKKEKKSAKKKRAEEKKKESASTKKSSKKERAKRLKKRQRTTETNYTTDPPPKKVTKKARGKQKKNDRRQTRSKTAAEAQPMTRQRREALRRLGKS